MGNAILKNPAGLQTIPFEHSRCSAEETFQRFNSAGAAAKYAKALEGTKRHHREIACIRYCLRTVPSASKVLDLPCGTGRLLPFLHTQGYELTAADSSPHMVQLTRERFNDSFPVRVANVFSTEFPDNAFDAIVCNRLFHHFREPETRRLALRELARICSSEGTLVVSFFCNFALDALRFHVKNALKSRKAKDRIPISYQVFAQEIASEGWEIADRVPVRPLVSPQWYLGLKKAK